MTGAIFTKFGLAPTTWTMVLLPSESREAGVPGTSTRFGGCVVIARDEPTCAKTVQGSDPVRSGRCHYAPGQPSAKFFTAPPPRSGRLAPTRRPNISPMVLGAREGNHP